MTADLRTELAGVQLPSPILLASGTCGYGNELAPFLDLKTLGVIGAKSLTLEPRQGNPPVRIAETPSGMLNAISLENVGVQAFIDEKLPALPPELAVFASVFGTDVEQYIEVCRRLEGARGVVGIELNASCPHVKSGGIEFGQDPALLGELVRRCRAATRAPLLVKLSPNVTSIADMARVCEAEGADGIALINTLQAMAVDIENRTPVLSNGFGGLSGPAIRPVALRMVYQVAQAVKLPVCGMGGISSAEDVLAFLICGASAIQVGTVSYVNPQVAEEIRLGLLAYLERHGIASIAELIGTLEFPDR